MGIISSFVDMIKRAFAWIKNIVRRVLNRVLNFVADVVNWFKRLRLDPKKDTPFIADAGQFKEMLKTAPRKDVGIFQGVYDEEADEIVANEYIEAEGVDAKTREIMKDEPLVVLS